MLNGTLPPRAIVDGDLSFTDERVPVFAVGMWIRGSLRVVNCGGVTSLPRNLRIDGFADFSMTPIAELPEGMRIGEWLDLSDTRVRKLPADLTVGWRILGFRPVALAAQPAVRVTAELLLGADISLPAPYRGGRLRPQSPAVLSITR